MTGTLDSSINHELKKTGGKWGIIAKALDSNEVLYKHNQNERFPAASIGKLPIALYVFNQVNCKNVKLTDIVELKTNYKLGGSGVLQHLHEGLNLSIEDVLRLMLLVSDNTSAKLLVKKFTPEAINIYLKSLGFKVTKLKIDKDKFGYGLTTPIEIVELLEGVYKNKYLSSELSKLFLNMMKTQMIPERIVRFLPEKIGEISLEISSKGGSIPGVRSDVGIIYTKNPYALAILSKDLTDDSHRPENKGVIAIARISELIFGRL